MARDLGANLRKLVLATGMLSVAERRRSYTRPLGAQSRGRASTARGAAARVGRAKRSKPSARSPPCKVQTNWCTSAGTKSKLHIL